MIPKERIIHILSVAGKILSVLTGLAAYKNLIPEEYIAYATISFTVFSILKEVLLIIGDYLDNGVRDNSFKG